MQKPEPIFFTDARLNTAERERWLASIRAFVAQFGTSPALDWVMQDVEASRAASGFDAACEEPHPGANRRQRPSRNAAIGQEPSAHELKIVLMFLKDMLASGSWDAATLDRAIEVVERQAKTSDPKGLSQ